VASVETAMRRLVYEMCLDIELLRQQQQPRNLNSVDLNEYLIVMFVRMDLLLTSMLDVMMHMMMLLRLMVMLLDGKNLMNLMLVRNVMMLMMMMCSLAIDPSFLSYLVLYQLLLYY
jgi:hypothetical protein